MVKKYTLVLFILISFWGCIKESNPINDTPPILSNLIVNALPTVKIEAQKNPGIIKADVKCNLSGSTAYAVIPSSVINKKFVITFTTGVKGAVVKANNVVQVSGVTVTDFTNPVIYTVTLPNGQSKKYTLRITGYIQKAADQFAQVMHVVYFGQSLSVGTGASKGTIISKAQKNNALMFSGGARAQDAGDNPLLKYTQLVPLVEQVNQKIQSYETSCSGFALCANDLILNENGKKLANDTRLLLSAPGQGSKSVLQLSKGSAYYNRLLDDVKYGLMRASELNKTYEVPAMIWVQGEEDVALGTKKDIYKARCLQLFADFNNDVKAITGQTTDVQVIMYQTACNRGYEKPPTIAIAQAELCEENANIHLSAPAYIYQYVSSTNAHLKEVSYRLKGGFDAVPFKRLIIDKKSYTHFYVKAVTAKSNVVEATFNVPTGDMKFDVSAVSNPGNYGFSIVESNGTIIPITSVTINRPGVVKIIADLSKYANKKMPAGARLQYAVLPGALKSQRGRGNLRDSRGDDLKFEPGGQNYAMHNWCALFDKVIM